MRYGQSGPPSSSTTAAGPAFLNSIAARVAFPLFLLQSLILGAVGHVITPAAQLPAPAPSAVHGNVFGGDDLLLEGQPLNWLGKRAIETCDEIGLFICPQGHCYEGSNGFVGCCSSTESCRVRTTCIEYDEVDETSCDVNTGGCVRCENQAAPYCVSLTNILEDQYAMYCDTKRDLITTSIENKITSASMALLPDEDDGSTGSRTASPASETDSTNEEDDDGSNSESLSGGAIAGIAIGSATATALIFFLMFWFCLRRRIEYRPRWMSRWSMKKNEQHGIAGATPLFAGQDYSPAHTPHGLGLNEFEGSTPDNKQHPWAPSSMAQYQPKPMAPYVESPELDGSPRSVNEVDGDNTSTISALPKGLRPQSGNTVSVLGSASISAYTPATPSFRESTISRDTREPLTRVQSQDLSLPQSLEISKPSIDGIAASASKTPANEDMIRQNINVDPSTTARTGNAKAFIPYSVPEQQQIQRDARYLSAEMALTGGYWEKKENDSSEGGDVRARNIESNESDTVTENGHAESR